MTDCRNAPNENRTWESFRPYDHQGLHEFFEAKRAENPIFFDEGTGHWIVTTRDLAREIFADPARFSAANVHDPLKPYPKELVDYLTQSGFRRDKTQANCDAPKHTRIRKVAQSFLNPRQFKALEPPVRKLVDAAVKSLHGRGRVDLVDELAYELPARVLFLLLGLPDMDARKIKVWADSRFNMISGDTDHATLLAAGQQVMDLWNYCGDLVAARRESPGEDYPSHLLAIHNRDPSAISVNEIQNLTYGVLLAGHETTTNAIGSTLQMLMQNRAQWDRLAADPSLAANFVEEGLRAAPPIVIWRRIPTRETVLGGVTLPAQAPIMMSLASVNRDESHFSCPAEFDGGRENAGDHLSFGYGIHFCMGAALARMEIEQVLQGLAAHFPNMRLVPDEDPHWSQTVLVRGPRRLIVELNE
jgi:cytochrome P450